MLNISALSLSAQVQKCFTHELIKQNSQSHPEYLEAVNSAFAFAKQNIGKNKTQGEDSILRVPVVVHIVYRDQTENIDDSLIYNQIQVLNEDYRRLNADASDTRQEFVPFASDAEIEFYLAEIDPDGNATTGIVRKSSTAPYFITIDLQTFSYSMDVVKYDSAGGSNAWPVDQYLNIWVCDLSLPLLGDALLGFAYPPVGAPNWPNGSTPVDPNADGVVVHYKVFGRNNPNANGLLADADRGRTTTHEVGHYLGLRHIWGDGDCSMDDGISDTPDADADAGFECDYSKNTCTENSVQYADMIENYMDYAKDACQNLFTQEQTDLMRSSLSNLRSGLLTDKSTAINNMTASKIDFQLFPSPAKEYFNIKMDDMNGRLELKILDVLGNEVKSFTLNSNSEYQYSVSNLKSGMYFLCMNKSYEKEMFIRKPLMIIH
jgi:hypothetical protein